MMILSNKANNYICQHFFIILSIITLLLLLLSTSINGIKLRGIALQSHPFVIKDGIYFNGYIIDILNAMKNFSDFDYYLNDANELAAQQSKSGSISFLLDQLWRNNAEFGVSYITVTDERRQLIDFTDPLLNYSISALIHKSNVGNMRSFNELADQTRITYGALRNGDTMKMFDGSGDMVVRRMLALMNSTGVPVDSLPEAVFRVRSERYAFIADSITIQQLARDNCDMTVIVNNWPQFRRSVAIALPKGSPYLRTFNSLIKRLIETNILYVIRERYWKIICNYNIGNTVTTTKLISLGMTFTSILLTTYLLN